MFQDESKVRGTIQVRNELHMVWQPVPEASSLVWTRTISRPFLAKGKNLEKRVPQRMLISASRI